MSDGWTTVIASNGVHVLPVLDKIQHETDDCVCQPQTEPIERDDGSVGWLITHAAWDGRI